MLDIVNEGRLTINPDNDNPYLSGPYASNAREYNADTESLQVIGEIPRDLHGMFVRNHHNQVHEPMGVYHPFDGDGMVHMISFKNGEVAYRNRFVQTKGLSAEMEAGKRLWAGLMENPALSSRPGWGAH
eukprot:gene35582-58558_t